MLFDPSLRLMSDEKSCGRMLADDEDQIHLGGDACHQRLGFLHDSVTRLALE